MRKRSAARLISGATVLEPSKESRPVRASSIEGTERILAPAVVSAASGSSDRAFPSAAGEREGEQQETDDGERAHRRI